MPATGTVTSLARLSRTRGLWLGMAIAVTCAGLWFFFSSLWDLWTRDGLRSIGMLIPPTSLVLCLRAWRGQEWKGGSWWGLGLMALSIGVALISPRLGTGVGYVAAYRYVFNFLPVGPLLWAYASGAVILLGGATAWRKAAFPLALLLFVNPVPQFFVEFMDLPLQHFGASVAWAFAGWVGIPVIGEPTELWLYFAPGYGMFIAPECNGLRSAVTLGYVTLVAGYLFRLSWPSHALYVTGGVLFAFVLNAARLCVLVLLNRLALGVPFLYRALEREAEWIDYMLYIPMFLVGALFLLGIPRLLARRREQAP
jgi:exosortase J